MIRNMRNAGVMLLTPQQLQQMGNYHQAALPVTTANRNLEAYAKRKKIIRDVFMSIEIVNNANVEQQAVLFDATGAFALQQNYTQPGTLSITSSTKSYQTWLRRLVSRKLIVNEIRLETLAGNEHQFDRPIGVWDDSSKSDNIVQQQTIYPSMGRNSMQEKLNLVEIKNIKKTIKDSTALTVNVLPTNRLTMRLFFTEIE